MNQLLQGTLLWIVGLVIVGFSCMGFLVWKLRKKIAILFGEVPSESDGELQRDILRRLMRLEMWVAAVEPRVAILETTATISLQKVGFMRFNPFQDTGGDNSFVIALLDQENSGVLLSSLYTRDGVRVFAKNIERGHTRYPLIAEEQKVLEETMMRSR